MNDELPLNIRIPEMNDQLPLYEEQPSHPSVYDEPSANRLKE